MQALPPDKQTDLRAYWLVHHSLEPDRAMLSNPASLGDLWAALAVSRGVDPREEHAKREREREDVMRRIAKHSGVDVDKVRGGSS